MHQWSILVLTGHYWSIGGQLKKNMVDVKILSIIVLQISRLSEGSTGQIFATSSVIYQMKMWGL